MEPHFNTSFIPKKPIVAGTPAEASRPHHIDILSTIAGGIFAITFLAAVGTYGYKFYVNNQIASIDKQINAARNSLDVPKIQTLINANSKILATNTLLQNHVALSKLLITLQSLTLKKISFGNFLYRTTEAGGIITMKGEVQTYNALAVEQDVFSHGAFIVNPDFSDFMLNQNGNIDFQFTASVDPKAISYKSSFENAETANVIQATP